jgi:3-deoxy-D-manno-octulosonate 8-phosphate phosphatase (KDO 8-P phosphatase)
LFKSRRASFQDIEAIVFDFDGVFTDNKVIVDENGKESVICNRADGLGIRMLQQKKIPLVILSSEINYVVAARARKLGLDVFYGVEAKKETLITYCNQHGFDLKKVMYIGNDLNDYEVMSIVGYPVAPKDAHVKIRRIAKFVIPKKGGEGVVKELAEKWIQ